MEKLREEARKEALRKYDLERSQENDLLKRVLHKAVEMHKTGSLSLSSDENDMICCFILNEIDVTIRLFPIADKLIRDKLITLQHGEYTIIFNIVHRVA